MSRAVRHALAVALAAVLLAGCEGAPPWDAANDNQDRTADTTTPVALPEPEPSPPESATAALADFLAAENIAETPLHRDAHVDLDGDGRDDLLMLLEDQNWCGSGGCTLLVFHNSERGYRLLSRIGPVHPPVAISTVTHGGWRSLLVGVGGGGTVAGTVALQFNGSGYPGNPTLLATLAPDALPQAQVVIE